MVSFFGFIATSALLIDGNEFRECPDPAIARPRVDLIAGFELMDFRADRTMVPAATVVPGGHVPAIVRFLRRINDRSSKRDVAQVEGKTDFRRSTLTCPSQPVAEVGGVVQECPQNCGLCSPYNVSCASNDRRQYQKRANFSAFSFK